jgi:arginine decarboxylase
MTDSAATSAGTKAGMSLSHYYNTSQLRADTWQRLKHLTSRLDEKLARKGDIARLKAAIGDALGTLEPIETYWAFPGKDAFQQLRRLFELEEHHAVAQLVARIVRALVSDSYRRRQVPLRHALDLAEIEENADVAELAEESAYTRPYFELLVVDNLPAGQEHTLKAGLREMRRPEDRFVYETLVVPSFEDALIAVLLNYNIQTVVIRYSFPLRSRHKFELLHRELAQLEESELDDAAASERGTSLAALIGRLRPELCVYLVTDMSVEEVAGKVPANCLRVFYQQEDLLELHLNILRGINQRYETPFFTALRDYSQQPTGVFHAMPISRGKSIAKSHWIQDMGQFYGMNIFLAETSATSGGLDSLLDPHGPIKKAQQLAARAFGAQRSYFVTNGTSTANKIVLQALVQPGDIVLIDRDCHKSHHYALVLSGAHVVYLESYPLHDYSMYGAVPLKEIKQKLLAFRNAGKLARVKALLLTNCTFDGIVYDVHRVMEECLAIKPDLVFVWDEAWFAFARCGVNYRRRTAMACAAELRERYRSAEYRNEYEAFQDFKYRNEDAFHEAYMTHTSTSPNYQILASLDVGRRQVELEGFELVKKQLEMAMVLRERITTHPLLSKYFRVLTVRDLIPPEFRASGIEAYYDPERGWSNLWDAWRADEFVLDATRITLFVGLTGIDGDTFKNRYLMDRYGIQINKTSRNTVLFMTNIGTTRSSVAYLIEVLVKIATELDESLEDLSPAELRLQQSRVRSLTEDLPALPDFSGFHDRFRPDPAHDTPEGDMRAAFFLAYDEAACEYVSLTDGTIDRLIAEGRELVSAIFVIPYPPGFPILVPGQVISPGIVGFLRALDVTEIHGLRPELGLRVFTEQALAQTGGASSLQRAAE